MSKHVFLHSEIIFFDYQEERASKFVKEYDQLFENLDLSEITRYNKGVGASGFDQHAMIKAMIVYTKEGYRSIPQLIRELEAKPFLSTYVLGFPGKLPDESTFYRFLKHFDFQKIIDLCAKANVKNLQQTGRKVNIVAIDSKPVVANTKENNPKSFIHNLTDKTILPSRSEESALGFYSSTNDINGKPKRNFYWGYKLHLMVDAETDTPLVWNLTPANSYDGHEAPKLHEMLKRYYARYFGKKLIQTADKGYWDRKVFTSFMDTCGGYSAISKNPGNQSPSQEVTLLGVPICPAGVEMRFEGQWYDNKDKCQRYRFRCANPDQECQFRRPDKRCTKTLRIQDPVPGMIASFTQAFQDVYSMRQSVERVNAFITSVGYDFPNHFIKASIKNLIGFALLAKALTQNHRATVKLKAA